MGYTDNFGEETLDTGNRIYLDLRAGFLAETQKIAIDENGQPVQRDVDKWTREGYELKYSENKAGKRTYFMAKCRRSISGFVTDLKWYSHTLKDQGVTLTGWKVVVETLDQVYWIQVSTKDRPYSMLMNALLKVDFAHTVKFMGYIKEGKKNLLLYQNDASGKDFVPGAYQARFLSTVVREKLRHGDPLTDKERENVAFGDDGAPVKDYPYILERADKTWNFDAWNEFLMDAVNGAVKPAIEAANAARGTAWKNHSSGPAASFPTHTGTGTGLIEDDDPTIDPDEAAEAAAIQAEGNSTAQAAAAGTDDIPF